MVGSDVAIHSCWHPNDERYVCRGELVGEIHVLGRGTRCIQFNVIALCYEYMYIERSLFLNIIDVSMSYLNIW